ncbi:MAG: hypothetical protein D3922_16320 [Candidatus Electrothrix sp. AR1]|nr:hypothetical protein [Candidatus Electrothrix sp. AR1]
MFFSTPFDNMNERTIKKQGKIVIRKVMKLWRKFELLDNQAYEKGINIIIKQVAKMTGEPVEQVGLYTDKVLAEFGEDFKKLPAEERTHEDMIIMIYIRCLYHMGALKYELGP